MQSPAAGCEGRSPTHSGVLSLLGRTWAKSGKTQRCLGGIQDCPNPPWRRLGATPRGPGTAKARGVLTHLRPFHTHRAARPSPLGGGSPCGSKRITKFPPTRPIAPLMPRGIGLWGEPTSAPPTSRTSPDAPLGALTVKAQETKQLSLCGDDFESMGHDWTTSQGAASRGPLETKWALTTPS